MRFIFTILGILVVVVIGLAIRTLNAAGAFATLEPVPAACASVVAPAGPEDIALDRTTGAIFVSSTDRRSIMGGKLDTRGDIYAMKASSPQQGARVLTASGDAPADFKPHGISLYDDGQGGRTLMVVNHLKNGTHAIEIFDVLQDEFGEVTLDHRRTVTDPLLISPNDVAAIDRERFYATNDHGNPPGFRQDLESWLILPEASIVYWDGSKMTKAAEGLSYANGIAVSRDGSTVFAAETTNRSVDVFTRNATTGALTLKQQIDTGIGVDNIDFDETGNIFVAAHPKMLALVSHSGDAKSLSPSQVIRIDAGPNGYSAPKTVYLNLGEEMSGSSTAIADKDTLFISDIFEPKLLVCRTK